MSGDICPSCISGTWNQLLSSLSSSWLKLIKTLTSSRAYAFWPQPPPSEHANTKIFWTRTPMKKHVHGCTCAARSYPIFFLFTIFSHLFLVTSSSCYHSASLSHKYPKSPTFEEVDLMYVLPSLLLAPLWLGWLSSLASHVAGNVFIWNGYQNFDVRHLHYNQKS